MWLIVLSHMILLVILTLPNISDFLQPFEPSIIPELISAFIDKCVSELLILPVSMGKLGLCNPFASAFLTLHFSLTPGNHYTANSFQCKNC